MEKILDKYLKKSDIFWLGYLICDPTTSDVKSSVYDMSIEEVKQIQFEGLPVVFNHNKHRNPLGTLVLSWHDHNYPNTSTFAVAFLAVMDNSCLFKTPAMVTLLGDSFVSLSTLKADPRVPVEISITYCGARNGCFGMFLPKKRVRSMCRLLGLEEHLQDSSYKRDEPMVCASKIMDPKENESEEKNGGLRSLEDVLGELNPEQFDIIKEAMSDNQKAIQTVCEKLENQQKDSATLREAVGLLSDYLSSMIQSRLSMERDSDSEIAQKRRQDFQAMKDKGIFSKDCSDLEAIREMIMYCRECFDDSSEGERSTALKIINMFSEKFPQLRSRLNESDSPLKTVDAAFQLINDHFQKDRVRDLVNGQREAKAHAMQVVRDQWKKVSSNVPLQDESINASADRRDDKGSSMDFETFAKRAGIFSNVPDEGEPPKKRRKCERDYEEQGHSEEFLQFAMEREKKHREAQDRFKSYLKEFDREKKERDQKKFEMMQKINDALPVLMKMADQLESMKSRKQEAPSPKVADNPKPEINSKVENTTIDASKMEVPQTSLLFDL